MLIPFSSNLDWRSQRSPWIQITSGLLQGHPLSALLYVLATDAWTRWVQQSMAPPCTISCFADDAQSTRTSVRDLLAMAPALEVVHIYMNLRAQYGKCRILPIGAKRADFAALLTAECDDTHPFRRIAIVDGMRVLGWWIGSGADLELDECARGRITLAVPKLHDTCLGLVGNQFLLERGILTIA
eukprot:5342296-Amphidinium_carterae.1